MPKPPARKPDVQKTAAPAPAPVPVPVPAPAGTAREAEPPALVTPVPEKIGEGQGNLKAREQAFKRRTGVR